MRRLSTEVQDKFTLAYSKPACHKSKMTLEKEQWLFNALSLPSIGPPEEAGDLQKRLCLLVRLTGCGGLIRLQTSPSKLPEQSLGGKNTSWLFSFPRWLCFYDVLSLGGKKENSSSCGVIPADSPAGGDL